MNDLLIHTPKKYYFTIKSIKMKKLLKIYNLKSREEYFDMILDSDTNGQILQRNEQFNDMPKAEKKMFLKYLIANNTDKWIICLFIDLI